MTTFTLFGTLEFRDDGTATFPSPQLRHHDHEAGLLADAGLGPVVDTRA